MGRGAAKKDKNINELKQELELDVHKVPVEELLKRFKTDVTRGLTDNQANFRLSIFHFPFPISKFSCLISHFQLSISYFSFPLSYVGLGGGG